MRTDQHHHDAPCEHNHGGNDINDHDIRATDDDKHVHHPDHEHHDNNRTDHDVAGDDDDRTRVDLNAAVANYFHIRGSNHVDQRILDRAVYDAAAAVLGTDGAADDEPDDLDPALYAYLVERARYDAGIADHAVIFAPLRDTARTWLASHG